MCVPSWEYGFVLYVRRRTKKNRSFEIFVLLGGRRNCGETRVETKLVTFFVLGFLFGTECTWEKSRTCESLIF